MGLGTFGSVRKQTLWCGTSSLDHADKVESDLQYSFNSVKTRRFKAASFSLIPFVTFHLIKKKMFYSSLLWFSFFLEEIDLPCIRLDIKSTDFIVRTL